MTDFFDQLETQLVEAAGQIYPSADHERTRVAMVLGERRRRSEALRAAKVRAWAVIGAAVGATIAGVLMVIAAAPATTTVDVTRTSRGLLSIVADGPLGMVALNERLSSMNLSVRVLKASRACDATARIATLAGAGSAAQPFALSSMDETAQLSSRGGWLDTRVALPRRLGQTLVLALVDNGRRLVEQTVTGVVPSCVAALPAGPTASALTS